MPGIKFSMCSLKLYAVFLVAFFVFSSSILKVEFLPGIIVIVLISTNPFPSELISLILRATFPLEGSFSPSNAI
ncbi:MAG TPA: hypothetical protein VJ201_08575 [Candidatus Babeliales bacterium]|nr:hypothetical protein [Candidatus Babeliales bacterium]